MVSLRIPAESHNELEGSFSTIVDKNKTRKLGWRIQTKFQLGLHIKDLPLLLKIQQYLGGIGSIHSTHYRFTILIERQQGYYAINDATQNRIVVVNYLI